MSLGGKFCILEALFHHNRLLPLTPISLEFPREIANTTHSSSAFSFQVIYGSRAAAQVFKNTDHIISFTPVLLMVNAETNLKSCSIQANVRPAPHIACTITSTVHCLWACMLASYANTHILRYLSSETRLLIGCCSIHSMLNWIVGGIGRMLPQPVVIQVSWSFAAVHPPLWPWSVLTFVSLTQDVHTDQVQKSKCKQNKSASLFSTELY